MTYFFHLSVGLLKDCFWLPWKFHIVHHLHSTLYLLEVFWVRQAGIVILSKFLFYLLFNQFDDIEIPDHDIFHQFMSQNSLKSFLLVLFLLEEFRQNYRNDLLLDSMLESFVGDELKLVALPAILETFACRLCLTCWVGWIVSWIRRFFGRVTGILLHRAWENLVTNQPVDLYSDWWNYRTISPELFIPHLEVIIDRLSFNYC